MRSQRILAVSVLAVALSLVAWGDSHGQDRKRSEPVRLSAMDLTRDRSKQEALSTQSEWLGFKSRYGEQWQALWRESTGTPHRVYGGSVKIVTAVPITGTSVVSGCEQFVRDNVALLKVAIADISVAKTINVAGKWGVIYKQKYQGLDVYRGRLDFRITGTGTLLYFGSDFYPGIDVSTVPTISIGTRAFGKLAHHRDLRNPAPRIGGR